MGKNGFSLLIALVCLVVVFPSLGNAQKLQADIASQIIRAEFEIPVITGLDSSEAEIEINTVLAESADRFRQSVTSDPHVLSAKSKYEVHQNGEGILSLTVINYTFSGGAHGMSTMEGFTFDLASGKRYRFSDLVAPDSMAEMSSMVDRQIKERNIPLFQPFSGLKQEPDFYILPDRKVVVFYQLYELAPYVWGFVRFPLPY